MNEGRHPPGSGPAWQEAWHFEFAAQGMAGAAGLTLLPNQKKAAVFVELSRDGAPHLVVRENDAPLPRGLVLEVTTSGLWAAFHCETPLQHWSVGVEAFAVADPDELERGEIVALGFDLEWEAAEEASEAHDGYSQRCAVSGEVLVGAERLWVEATGDRSHRWGPR